MKRTNTPVHRMGVAQGSMTERGEKQLQDDAQMVDPWGLPFG
jgi:hypothetical protein